MEKALMMLGALALAGALSVAQADEYPDGCVSCHVQGEIDTRLNAVLSNVGHGRGGERTLNVPTGCNRCHATDGSGNAASISKLIHSVHYGNPEFNQFTTQYEGDCRHCHSMNAAVGIGSIKVGERNWTLRILHPEEAQANEDE